MRATRDVNDSKPHIVPEDLRERLKGIRNPVVACLWLAYKADVDDLRESLSLEVVSLLAREPVREILVVEPNIRELPNSISKFDNVNLINLDTALERTSFASWFHTSSFPCRSGAHKKAQCS